MTDKKRLPDVEIPILMDGHSPESVQEMAAVFRVALAAITVGTAKGMGTMEGDLAWNYGDDKHLTEAVKACPLFEHHSAALLEFVDAVHAASFVLAEDVEGARMAAKIEQGRERGH